MPTIIRRDADTHERRKTGLFTARIEIRARRVVTVVLISFEKETLARVGTKRKTGRGEKRKKEREIEREKKKKRTNERKC